MPPRSLSPCICKVGMVKAAPLQGPGCWERGGSSKASPTYSVRAQGPAGDTGGDLVFSDKTRQTEERDMKRGRVGARITRLGSYVGG